jgi:hypothetical protein
MDITHHKNSLHKAQTMVASVLRQIERLEVTLKNWQRLVEIHEAAIAHAETEALRQRVRELEIQLGQGSREVDLEEE